MNYQLTLKELNMKNFLLVTFFIGVLVGGGFDKAGAQDVYFGASLVGNNFVDSLDDLNLAIGLFGEAGVYLSGGDVKNNLVSVAAGYLDRDGFAHYPILAQYTRFFGNFFAEASVGGQFIDYGQSSFYLSAAPVVGVKFGLFDNFSGAVSLEYVILEDHPDLLQARISVGLDY
jgi:hypothetical protein